MGNNAYNHLGPGQELNPAQFPRLWGAARQLMEALAGGEAAPALQSLARSLAGLLQAERARIYLPARKSGRLIPKASHPDTEVNALDFPTEPLQGFAAGGGGFRIRRFSAADEVFGQWQQVGILSPNACALLLAVFFDDGGKLSALVTAENKGGAAAFPPEDEALAGQWAEFARGVLAVLKAQADAAAQQAALRERLAQVSEACGLANAELARAARLSDQFLANMSHELRTPLNTILGMSQALQEGVMGPMTDDQMSYLQMVEKAGRHLLTMITDILTLSKAGAGRLELHSDVLSVQAVCQECVQFVVQPSRQKHQKLEVKCDPRVTTLEADENILKQILVNLLTNAVKFTPERGAVTLEVTGDPQQQWVAFEVRDTGIGISPENFGRLFQPFVQLDDGLARTYPGTGLGLSLILRLSELHGGSVAVESQLGQGAKFTVRLPWVPAPAPSQPPVVPKHEKARILLVEDNERTIKRLQDSLATAGHLVTIARQGAEALERASEERPALMVVDLELAGMNGWALLQHIRSNPRLAGISVVALTALVLPGDRESCLQGGADEYLIKPVARDVLLTAVDRCLEAKGNGTTPGLQ